MIIEIGLLIAFLSILGGWLYTAHGWRQDEEERQQRWQAERNAWAVERQQLLDRIQAPSFAEYKQAEVKTIKAQNGISGAAVPLEQL